MKNPDRRKFIVKTTAMAFVAPTAIGLGSSNLFAQELPLVDESSPQAQALKYVAASATDGQTCGNCALYQGADADVGPCALFPGSGVAKAGWCSAWVKKS